jgi:hypothetical protein
MAIGMAMAIMIVERNFLRKKRSTKTAKRPPTIPERLRSLRLFKISRD